MKTARALLALVAILGLVSLGGCFEKEAPPANPSPATTTP